MTPEQAKQLKYGDKILVEAEVQSVCDDGDVEFLYPFRLSNGREEIAAANVIPQRVSLMKGTPNTRATACSLLTDAEAHTSN